MAPDDQRWDVGDPHFLFTVLQVMVGCWVLVVAIGALGQRAALWGFLSGGLLAVASFLVAIQTGRIFTRTHHFAAVMITLLSLQAVLWLGMILLIAVLHVDLVGFTIGVSVLPAAIVLTTLYWWLVKRKGVP